MSDRVINLTLPMPPPVNNLYATVQVGKPGQKRSIRIPSREAKQFKLDVDKICDRLPREPFIGDVAVSVKFYRQRRVGDIDNYFKALLDSLKGFAFHDDKQISWLHAERFEDKENPRVEVQIWGRSLL